MGTKFLLINDPKDITLVVEAYDQDILSADDCIGTGRIQVTDLLNLQEKENNDGRLCRVPVPIHEDAPKGWFGLGGGRRRAGTVYLELQFVPFNSTPSAWSSKTIVVGYTKRSDAG